MAPTAEDKLDYILTCLKHSGEIEPDFHAVAGEKSLSNANTAQKGFKKYIEESGKYKLVNRKVIPSDGSGVAPTTPAKPDKRGRKKPEKKGGGKEPPVKKRKVEAMDESDTKGEDSEDETVD